jgi:hypothetical protein
MYTALEYAETMNPAAGEADRESGEIKEAANARDASPPQVDSSER